MCLGNPWLFLRMSAFALQTAICLQLTDIPTRSRAAEEHTSGMHVFPESDFVPSAAFAAASLRTQLTLTVQKPSEAEIANRAGQGWEKKGGRKRKLMDANVRKKMC